MADKRDQKGCLSEAVQIYPGQNKDGAFVLHIKELLRAQVAEDKLNAPLPRDEAPNKQILRQATRADLIRALKIIKSLLTLKLSDKQSQPFFFSLPFSHISLHPLNPKP